jgi:hypothetical protein
MYQRRFGEARGTALGRLAARIATFHYVCFAWIFFRAPTFGHARLVLARIGKLSWAIENVSPMLLTILGLALVTHFLPDRWIDRLRIEFARTPAPVQGALLALAALAVHAAAGTEPQPFVYGQF